MSTRPGDSRKGWNQQLQKKYVQKKSLTSSLRQNSTDKINLPGNYNKHSRQQNNESSVGNGKLLESKRQYQQKGRFVVYLPRDDVVAEGLGVEDGLGLDAEETQAVFDLLNQELSALLKMAARDFWKTVAADVSLHQFLDTFLQYKRRWYDINHHTHSGTIAGSVIAGEQELCRRVFMVLYRMSSNKDCSGAPAKESLDPVQHKNLLLEKRLLDIPKLMDICAIFGHDNSEITRSLVSNALSSQPEMVYQLKEVVPQFLHIVHVMHMRIDDAWPTPKVNVKELHEDILDVMNFINDAVATMDAFVEVYAPAAAIFISSYANEGNYKQLLPALTNIHDSLLPVLHKGLVFTTKHGLGLDVQPCLNTLVKRILSLSWKLLYACYLSESLIGFSHIPSSNIFPAQVEDPGVRGDIIVQVIGDMAGNPHRSTSMSAAFFSNLNRRHNLMNTIDDLCQNGWIQMDQEHYDYISKFVGQSQVKRLQTVESNNISQTAPHDMSTLTLKDEEEKTVILESKISQIKDVFPDYGDGYLSVCLDIYDNNVEEVIQRILEGTLHPDLICMDTTLELKPKPSNKKSSASLDKGKNKIHESIAYNLPEKKPKLDCCYSKERVIDAASSSCSTTQFMNLPPSLSPEKKCSGGGRYVRRLKDMDLNTVNTFPDQQDVKNNSLLRSLILATQYEDEYDDSLDELGIGVVDPGLEEIEDLDDNDDVQGTVTSGHGSYVKSKYMEQHKPQFYVKDGKNYSYQVAGAVGVSSVEEAETLKQAGVETIYGLGRGGNLPQKATESSSAAAESSATDNNDIYENRENVQGGNQSGRRHYRRGNAYFRKKNNDNHDRKDGAMKKNFGGVGRY